jgi:6-phosphogluconolactonase
VTSINRWLHSCIWLASLSLAAPMFGQFVYVGTPGGLWGYTAGLTPIPGLSNFPLPGDPQNLTVDPTGRFLYVGMAGLDRFPGYSIDPATGTVTPIPGSPFLSGVSPTSVAVNPAGTFAYATNSGSNTISAYSVDAATGALTPLPGSPFGAEPFPYFAQVSPNGKFLYVGGGSGLSEYSIDPTTGALKTVGFTALDSGLTTDITINPTGQYLYATPNMIAAYDVNSSNGTLTPIPVPSLVSPTTIVLHPTGRFAYMVTNVSDDVYAFTIDANTGALTAVPGSPYAFVDEGMPFSVGMDPTGNFVYVGAYIYQPVASAVIALYSVNPSTGALTPVGSPVETGGCAPASTSCGTQAIAVAPAQFVAPSPTAVSVTPNSGSGANQVFAFEYSDTNGYTHLSLAYAGFGPTAYGDEHTCRVEYVRATNALYLKNDAGTVFLGPVTPGGVGTLSNSQCALNASESAVSGSGNILTLRLALSFTPAFAGTQGIFMYADDRNGQTTPGRLQRGTWIVP